MNITRSVYTSYSTLSLYLHLNQDQRNVMAGSARYDVIVVGAGVEGSGAAYYLAKQGKKVLQIEQFSLPHTRGSSHGQSRIIRKAYTKSCYAEMMNEAYAMWRTLEQEAGASLYRKTGLLVVSEHPSTAVNDTEQALSRVKARFRRLNSDQLRREFPTFRFSDKCEAIFEDEGGVLWADKCVQALQRRFVAMGGTLRDCEPVTAVLPRSASHVEVTTATGGRYEAASVILATGAWSGKMLRTLGLNLPFKVEGISVYYWRQKSGGYHADDKFPAFICEDVGGFENHCYGLPALEYGDLCKVCVHCGKEVDPDQRDLNPTSEDQSELREFIGRHLPGLETKPSIVERCMYTTTPDSDFILDRHPRYRNVVIGAGFSGHGFKMAPVVGKILGSLATSSDPGYDLSPFRITRFKDQQQAKL